MVLLTTFQQAADDAQTNSQDTSGAQEEEKCSRAINKIVIKMVRADTKGLIKLFSTLNERREVTDESTKVCICAHQVRDVFSVMIESLDAQQLCCV